MPKANTYRAERMLGPHGFSVTDVMVIEGNRRRPATFTKVGDFIDLNKVNVRELVKSAVSGQINKLLVGGALSTMQQEVSDQIETEIQQALADLGLSNFADHPIASNVRYVSLEPGVMVAVAVAPEKPKEVLVHAPEPEAPMTAQLEPGLMAPTGNAGGGAPEVLAEAVAETLEASRPSGKGKKGKKAEAAKAAESSEPFADWKFNLDFQTCKRTIIESTDKTFLAWVSANDDSVQFQKLAKTRLAEA
jgi:hypothetical protein